ncbi:hypothetical protein B0H19DRAFT_1248675 [Mycena capillaripes]|nr:hypothetical protein B0H19DRAFT_1248675 [Mycena capillaripes]
MTLSHFVLRAPVSAADLCGLLDNLTLPLLHTLEVFEPVLTLDSLICDDENNGDENDDDDGPVIPFDAQNWSTFAPPAVKQISSQSASEGFDVQLQWSLPKSSTSV